MSTPEFDDDDPAAYERVRFPLEGVALAELWRIAQQGRVGEARMSSEEKALAILAVKVAGVPFEQMWRVNASLAGCRHEPETLAAARQIQAIDAAIDASIAAFDAAWAEISRTPCKNHRWSNIDHCCRCCECGLPLKDSDPTD